MNKFFALLFAFSLGSLQAQTDSPTLLKDLNNSSFFKKSDPIKFIASPNAIYFAAKAGDNFGTYFPIVSDHTTAGTDSITFPDFSTISINGFNGAPLGNDLILMNNSTLFKLNAQGAVKLMDGFDASPSSKMNEYNSFELNGKLYFWAKESSGSIGVELYVTDGTASGTQLFKDFSASQSSLPGIQQCYYKHGNNVYFLVKVDGDLELWKTDGSIANTVKLYDVFSSYSGDYVKFPFKQLVGGKIFIAGFDQYIDPTNDQLTNLNGNPGALMENSYRLLNDEVYYLKIINGPGVPAYQIWKSDASGNPTQVSSDTIASAYVVPKMKTSISTIVKDKVIFLGNDVHGGTNNYFIWASDGTSAGTEIIDTITISSTPVAMWACGNKRLAIQLSTDDLYLTDGSKDSTWLAVPAQSNVIHEFYMDEHNCRLYFAYKENNTIHTEPYYLEMCPSFGQTAVQKVVAASDYELKAFPNPATQQTTLHFEETQANIAIQILDIQGKIILTQIAQQEQNVELNLTTLTPGIYIVRVLFDNKIAALKLVKQ